MEFEFSDISPPGAALFAPLATHARVAKARLTALEQEKAQTEARLRAGKHAPVLQLHTNLPELYRNKIGRLAEALSAPETVAEAAEVMRGLIDRIVLTPAAGELRAELHGDLAVLARFAQEGEQRSAADTARLSVVAGERNPLYRTFFKYPP